MQHKIVLSEHNSPRRWLAALLLVISTEPIECAIWWKSHYFSLFLDSEGESRLVRSREEPAGI
jgi:hypothetical protein